MILDVIEIPFKIGRDIAIRNNKVWCYDGGIPVELYGVGMEQEVYVLGHATNKDIENIFYRYKIIEQLHGCIIEHVALTEHPINLFKQHAFMNQYVYILSSKIHTASGIKVYNYIQPLRDVLRLLGITENVYSVHQLFINSLLNMQNYVAADNKVKNFLSQYIADRKVRLNKLTISDTDSAISILQNIRDVYNTLNISLLYDTYDYNEIISYVDDSIMLPKIPSSYGLFRYILKPHIYSFRESDIVKLIDKAIYGKYTINNLDSEICELDEIDSINAHLQDGIDGDYEYDMTLKSEIMTLISDIDSCGYSDISIEIPFLSINDMTEGATPNVIIHYAGSLFNNYGISSKCGNIRLNLDIQRIFSIVVELFNGTDKMEYERCRPSIFICRTFAEDMYIKFVYGKNTSIMYFDFTMMNILGPILLEPVFRSFISSTVEYSLY